MTRTALITGITGQDGSYMADLLLSQGYAINGIVRRTSNASTGRIAGILDKITCHTAELTEAKSVESVVKRVKPDEVFHFGAQSHVGVSEICPAYTRATIYNGTANMLMACSSLKNPPKFYSAHSSEQFGNANPPQHEGTPFEPVSPYAEAKVDAHVLCHSFRERMPVWCGILFNHESPRRGEGFVTRKITRALGRMACGLQETCSLGDLSPRRDWGYAGDYIECVWKMLQVSEPDDFVIASGESHSVREFLAKAVQHLYSLTGQHFADRFIQDKTLFRKHEVNHLEGDSRKARLALDWKPKVMFDDLVKMMVAHDLELARDELAVIQRRKGVAA